MIKVTCFVIKLKYEIPLLGSHFYPITGGVIIDSCGVVS